MTEEVKNNTEQGRAPEKPEMTGNGASGDAKTYSQAELDRMFVERAGQAERSLLKRLGFEKPEEAEALVKKAREAEEANKSELQKALDDRTCPSCFGNMEANTHWRGFWSHPNCRCSPVPETYSWGELGARYGIDLSELLGEEEARYYKKLVWNGLAKQNLSADELIKFASLDLRPLQEKEIDKVVSYVADIGFNNSILQPAGKYAGWTWKGHVLGRKEMLPIGEVHYLKHVLEQEEWPSSTTLEDYYQSIKSIILARETSIFVSRYNDSLQLGFIGPSGKWSGQNGSDKILVEFRS